MKLLSLLSILALFASCSQQNAAIKKEKEAIIKCWTDWEVKAKAGDPAYYWTDDAVVMGQGMATIKGKEEFLKMFANLIKMPGFSMTWDKEPSVIEISEDGQMAYLLAKNIMAITDSSGAVHTTSNQAMQVWKKNKEGNWRAAVSMMYPEPVNK